MLAKYWVDFSAYLLDGSALGQVSGEIELGASIYPGVKVSLHPSTAALKNASTITEQEMIAIGESLSNIRVEQLLVYPGNAISTAALQDVIFESREQAEIAFHYLSKAFALRCELWE